MSLSYFCFSNRLVEVLHTNYVPLIFLNTFGKELITSYSVEVTTGVEDTIMFFLVVLLECLHVIVFGNLYDIACPLKEMSLPEVIQKTNLRYVEECATVSNIAGGAAFSFDSNDNLCTLYTKNIEVDPKNVCGYKENMKYFNRKSLSKCSEGWHSHATQCFYTSNNTLSWEKAKEQCLQLGGNLASIQDNSTNSFLLAILDPALRYWLGGNDIKAEGTWMWEGKNVHFSFTYWSLNEPNNAHGKQNCLLFRYSGNDNAMKWFDRDCNNRCNYVCEIMV